MGSLTFTITIGIVLVASFAARVAAVCAATITWGSSRTSSAARAGSRSYFPSAQWYVMTRFFPVSQPRSLSNSSIVGSEAPPLPVPKYATRYTFPACWAPATSGVRMKLIARTTTSPIRRMEHLGWDGWRGV